MPKFLTSIDMVQNEIQNAVIENLSSAPLNPVEGQVYYNTTDFVEYMYVNGAWKDISSADVTKTLLQSTTVGNSGANLVGVSNINGISGLDVQTVLANLKSYVDSVKQSLDVKDSVIVATTSANAGMDIDNAPITIDGVTLNVGDRVLVKDGAYSSVAGDAVGTYNKRNGIYEVSQLKDTNADSVDDAVALIRSKDADSNTQVTAGMFTFVERGTENSDSGFVLTTDGAITLDTSPLSFSQFSGAGQIMAGNGIVKSGNEIDVVGTANRIKVNADSIDIDPNYVGQTSINTLGSVTTGTWNADNISIAKGGTGASDAKTARTNLGATGKYAQTVGDGTTTSFTITHNLGTQDVMVQVRQTASPYSVVNEDISVPDANTVTVNFASAPSANQYRIVVIG